jgi:hypothetical protein
MTKAKYLKENKPESLYHRRFQSAHMYEGEWYDLMDQFFAQKEKDRKAGKKIPDTPTVAHVIRVEGLQPKTIEFYKLLDTPYWVKYDTLSKEYEMTTLFAIKIKGNVKEPWDTKKHGPETTEMRVKRPKDKHWTGLIYEVHEQDGSRSVMVKWKSGKIQKINKFNTIMFEWKEDYDFFSRLMECIEQEQ